ncbi:MAG: type VI secretion system tube protein Hcp [Acidobacteriota bacterium]
MKYEGIVGPVKGQHAGWIELESCQLGTSVPSNAARRSAEKQQISDIRISKRMDTSSTLLFRAAISGIGSKITIDFVNGDGVAYMTLDLDDALISSTNVSGNGGRQALESMSLNFTKITVSTKPAPPGKDADALGSRAGWQVAGP